MKYWESATLSSFNPTCVSAKSIRVIKLLGIIGYTLLMVGVLIYAVITFPGYVNDNSLD
jgi:hypothetical protein